MKKVWKFLSSMKFAIILLVVLAAACSLGSFIQQGKSYEYYAAEYGEQVGALIIALDLDDAFHSWWFVVINGFLCFNLTFCNLIRLPELIERTKSAAEIPDFSTVSGETDDPEGAMKRLGMPAPRALSDGRLISSKNRAGLWGAWVCHLGIPLLIIGFGLGQSYKQEFAAYGVAGQTREIGDTGYELTIDDFQVLLREDDTVEQYIADITVRDPRSGESESAAISVNNPADLFGMRFYQNSTGWAARVNITKDGAPLQSEVLCAGEYIPVADKPELVIYFTSFYPDATMSGGRPATASGKLNNPAYLYQVYYMGEILGMNILYGDEPLTIDEYEVRFTEPQSYTLIAIKRDPFTPLALLGGLVVTLGLFLAFYLQPKRVWAVKEGEKWTLYGECRKGGVLFTEKFLKAIKGDKTDAAS